MDKKLIIKKSLDIMEEVRNTYNETVGIMTLIPGTGKGQILERIEGEKGVSVRFDVDFIFPLHIAAPAKAMLAQMPTDKARKIIEMIKFTRFTSNTICSVAEFEEEVACTRERGYAIDLEEHNAGCHCVAAAICDELGDPVAGIWLSSFANRLPISKFDDVAKTVVEAANRISSRLNENSVTVKNRDERVLKQAARYLETNMTAAVDFKEFAKSIGVSYSWFRSNFKNLFGVSPKQYQLNCRLEKSKELLVQTDMSIKEIASELGYDNQNYFSNLFHKKIGQYPSDFRS